MKRILVTGSGGQLGQSIHELSSEFSNLEFVFKPSRELDITNGNLVHQVVEGGQFDYCINCAAYTDVEQAEKTPEIAFQVNAEGVKHLAIACQKNEVILIHISTDYVFDGEKTEPYTTKDLPNPINEYGKSKLLGEENLAESLSNFYIIRTSWLYSNHGKNFYKTVLDKAEREETLRITDEQTGCPTHASNLARFILGLIVSQSQQFGIYHFTDGEAMTWHDFANKILETHSLKNTTQIVRDNNYRSFAKRPKYSVLFIDRLR